ncbi:MAG: hypothetical protein Faunusvirus50_6 [Faunusvirus sp.]|jgi:hypothetical protein|uniref:Uncharacterized protein n=1 Tax=Faunusvirus sp. TaxID=2487766 RepID=A0A3G4ZY46_9VIRU|nr:MAG: hypothetical protein Faunusvirus50_6 [Faunusvirus sp.]
MDAITETKKHEHDLLAGRAFSLIIYEIIERKITIPVCAIIGEYLPDEMECKYTDGYRPNKCSCYNDGYRNVYGGQLSFRLIQSFEPEYKNIHHISAHHISAHQFTLAHRFDLSILSDDLIGHDMMVIFLGNYITDKIRNRRHRTKPLFSEIVKEFDGRILDIMHKYNRQKFGKICEVPDDGIEVWNTCKNLREYKIWWFNTHIPKLKA